MKGYSVNTHTKSSPVKGKIVPSERIQRKYAYKIIPSERIQRTYAYKIIPRNCPGWTRKAQGAQAAQGAQQHPEEPRKRKLYGFLQELGITVNNDVFEERIKQRKNI